MRKKSEAAAGYIPEGLADTGNNCEAGRSAAGMYNAAGKPYGELIREYRKRKGISQAELGKLADVKQNAVGAWEAGRSRPDLASIPALCRELSLPMSVFFGLEEDGPSFEEVTLRYRLLNAYNRQVILKQMDALYELQQQSESAPDSTENTFPPAMKG